MICATPAPSALLLPTLKRLLGVRYNEFMAAFGDAAPLRVEANAGLVGEGTVANTLGYQGAFVIFGCDGSVFAVIKSVSSRHLDRTLRPAGPRAPAGVVSCLPGVR